MVTTSEKPISAASPGAGLVKFELLETSGSTGSRKFSPPRISLIQAPEFLPVRA